MYFRRVCVFMGFVALQAHIPTTFAFAEDLEIQQPSHSNTTIANNSSCYTSQSEASQLLIQLDKSIRLLDGDTKAALRIEDFQVHQQPLSSLSPCNDSYIKSLESDVESTTKTAWRLLRGFLKPSEASLTALTSAKDEVIKRLFDLRVYFGEKPTECSLVLMYPLEVKVKQLGRAFNQTITSSIRQSQRLLQQLNISSEAVADFVLHPSRSVAELTEIVHQHPAKIPAILPKIITQWHQGSADFEDTLNFIRQLPTVENEIVGYAEIAQTVSRHVDADVVSLLTLAMELKKINDTVDLESVDWFARSQLDRLLADLWPLSCVMFNKAYELGLVAARSEGDASETAYLASSPLHGVTWTLVPTLTSGGHELKVQFKSNSGHLLQAAPSTGDSMSNGSVIKKVRLSGESGGVSEQWKIVPAEGVGTRFKIMNLMNNGALVAQIDNGGYNSNPVVYVVNPMMEDHIEHQQNGMDLWSFSCCSN